MKKQGEILDYIDELLGKNEEYASSAIFIMNSDRNIGIRQALWKVKAFILEETT
jgi:hypothetical protein